MRLTTNKIEINSNIILKELVNGLTPLANYHTLYFKSDNNLYSKDSTGTEKIIGGGISSGTVPIVTYSNQTVLNAVSNKLYLLEGTTTVNLPVGTNGDIVGIADYASNFDVTNVTINPVSGSTIAHLSSLLVNTKNACIQLAFYNNNWTILSSESFYELTGNVGASPAPDGGGLVNLQETLFTSTPYSTSNAAVNLKTINTVATDLSLNLEPKNNGAFYLGPVADNTILGGNIRGNKSVDLQLSRTVSTQIVSGVDSFAAGKDNTVSGDSCIAIGENNSVAGYACMAMGSYNNITADYAGYALGDSAIITQEYSFALQGGSDKGRMGVIVYNSGMMHQATQFVQRCQTSYTNPTVNLITTDPASNYAQGPESKCLLEDKNVYVLEATVLGVSNLQNIKRFNVSGVIKRGVGPGTVAFVGSPTITSMEATPGASTWSITLNVDTTMGAVVITVSSPGLPGDGSENVTWAASVRTLELLANY